MLLIAVLLWAGTGPVPQWKLDLCKQKVQPDRQMCLKKCEILHPDHSSPESLRCQSDCQLELNLKFDECLRTT